MNSFSTSDALIGIGLTAAMSQRLIARPAYDGESPMRVIELRRDAVCLHDGRHEVLATLPPTLALSLSDDALAVGDWVLADQPAPGRWRVVERVPPLTQIARRTNDGRGAAKRQVLVANVDTAFLVMGLDRDFNARRLERYLALAHLAAVPAVLVLTKADTLDGASLQRRIDEARDALGAGTPLLSRRRARRAIGRAAGAVARTRPDCGDAGLQRRRQEHADQHAVR